MSEKRPSRRRRPGRPQAPPPALMSDGATFEGSLLLHEGSGFQAILLWQSFRDVLLWAGAADHERGLLFREGAEAARLGLLLDPAVEGSLRAPLVTLAGVLRNDGSATREEVASACQRISRWAEERGMPQTAISFAQAAAVAEPRNAAHAYRVGLLCRESAEYARAETWFRRAIGLARKTDPEMYGLAHVGLGNIHRNRGSYEPARIAYQWAVWVARRKGLRNLRVMALHNLFSIAVEQVQVAEAERLARLAYRAYPSTHPRLPALAHDVASFWMLQGCFARALPVFQAVLQLIHEPSERLLVLSNIARAAGGAGHRQEFVDAWVESWRIIDRNISTERVCSAILNLAYGSASLGDRERKELAARYALDRAECRGETGVQQEAKALLRTIQAEQPLLPKIPTPEDSEITLSAEALAEEMVRELTEYAGEPIESSPPRTLW